MKDKKAGNTESRESAALEQVQDLLFGRHLAEIHQRFDKIENRIEKSLTKVENELRQSLANFEDHARSEIESLTDRIKSEEAERKALNDKSTAAVEDVVQQLKGRAKTLEDNIRSRFDELTERIEKETTALDDGKADRHDLSSLFANLATHLNGGSGRDTGKDRATDKDKGGSGKGGSGKAERKNAK